MGRNTLTMQLFRERDFKSTIATSAGNSEEKIEEVIEDISQDILLKGRTGPANTFMGIVIEAPKGHPSHPNQVFMFVSGITDEKFES